MFSNIINLLFIIIVIIILYFYQKKSTMEMSISVVENKASVTLSIATN